MLCTSSSAGQIVWYLWDWTTNKKSHHEIEGPIWNQENYTIACNSLHFLKNKSENLIARQYQPNNITQKIGNNIEKENKSLKQEKQQEEASSFGVSQVSTDDSAMSSRLGNISNTLNTAPIKALPLTVGSRDCDNGWYLLGVDEPTICRGRKWLMFPHSGDGDSGGDNDQMTMSGAVQLK